MALSNTKAREMLKTQSEKWKGERLTVTESLLIGPGGLGVTVPEGREILTGVLVIVAGDVAGSVEAHPEDVLTWQLSNVMSVIEWVTLPGIVAGLDHLYLDHQLDKGPQLSAGP